MDLLRYETAACLSQYLLFHYGSENDQLAFPFGPKMALNFPTRSVTECLDLSLLPRHAIALDLGCAVGRASFELARYCERVVGVDNSHSFISTAQELQQMGQLKYSISEEGAKIKECVAKIPENIDPRRVEFRLDDIMNLFQKPTPFHVVLAVNLLCRLSDPSTFLELAHKLVAPGGQFILSSPYSWLEEFTPKNNWIGGIRGDQKSQLEYIKEILNAHFHFIHSFDMPFLMRQHFRLYQWGVSQTSIWKRR